MKLVLTTVYDNIDEKWLSWYINYLAYAPQPEVQEVAEKLKAFGFAKFSNADPTDPKVIGTTTYELHRDVSRVEADGSKK